MNSTFLLAYVMLLVIVLATTSMASAYTQHRVTEADLSPYSTSATLSASLNDLEETCSIMKISAVSRGAKTLEVVNIKGGPQKVTMLFGEHARELISAESALRFVRFLCGKAHTAKDIALAQRVLAKYSFQIFPNVNPLGRKIVEQGSYCHRTNDNHVDLNRNWDIKWKSGGKAETAPGPHAFSEPEVQIVKDSVTVYKPNVFFSIHSGALGMYTPYAYKRGNKVVNRNAHIRRFLTSGKRTMMDVLKEVNKSYCNCDIGPAARLLNYECPGNCMDYAFDTLQTPFSFAFEIWDGQNFATPRSQALVEIADNSEEELDLNAMFDLQHDHDHDHDAETEVESDEEDQDQYGDDESEIIALQTQERVNRRGHSCFNPNLNPNFDDFAPTKEMEGLVALEISAEVTKSGATQKPFPVPSNLQMTRCFNQFNPSGKEMFDKTLNHWSSAFLTILDKLPAAHTL